MHLTREAIDTWAANQHRMPYGTYLVRLDEGDVFDGILTGIAGPAIVELVVWRDGGWTARELSYETPESIALAAYPQRVFSGVACGAETFHTSTGLSGHCTQPTGHDGEHAAGGRW